MFCAGTRIIPFSPVVPGAARNGDVRTDAGDGPEETEGTAEKIEAALAADPDRDEHVAGYGEATGDILARAGTAHLADASQIVARRVGHCIGQLRNATSSLETRDFRSADAELFGTVEGVEWLNKHAKIANDSIFQLIEAAYAYAKELGCLLCESRPDSFYAYGVRLSHMKKLADLFTTIRSRLELSPFDSFRFSERMHIFNFFITTIEGFLSKPSDSFTRLKELTRRPRTDTLTWAVQNIVQENRKTGTTGLLAIPPYLTLGKDRFAKFSTLITQLMSVPQSYIKILFTYGRITIRYKSESPTIFNEGQLENLSRISGELGIKFGMRTDVGGSQMVDLEIPDEFWDVDHMEFFSPERNLLGLGQKFAKFSRSAKERIAARFLGFIGKVDATWIGDELTFAGGIAAPVTSEMLNRLEASGVQLRLRRLPDGHVNFVFVF